jgi:hypothetical protein
MSFTYDQSALTVFRNRLRLRIGDVVEFQGPRPDGRNFSDAELDSLATDESDSFNGAMAAVFEILAVEWTQYGMSQKEADLAFDAKGLAEKYLALAFEWRRKAGTLSTTGIVTLVREDAYTLSGVDEYAS